MRWAYRKTKEHLRKNSGDAQRFSSDPSDFGASGEGRGSDFGASGEDISPYPSRPANPTVLRNRQVDQSPLSRRCECVLEQHACWNGSGPRHPMSAARPNESWSFGEGVWWCRGHALVLWCYRAWRQGGCPCEEGRSDGGRDWRMLRNSPRIAS